MSRSNISYRNLFTKEFLIQEYVINKKSSIDISNECGVSKRTILKYLNEYNITKNDQKNSYEISKSQHDFIIGSILGDGTFNTDGADYRMSFRQAENQKEYLELKLDIMKNFCRKKTYGISDGNKKATEGRSQLMYYFHTRSLSIFNKYKDMSITECLYELNETSFSFWILDDGCLTNVNPKYTPYYTLSAKRFTQEEINLAQKIFKERFDIKSSISKNKNPKLYNNKNKIYERNGFYFPTSETEKIKKLIMSCDFGEKLSETMSYKIHY